MGRWDSKATMIALEEQRFAPALGHALWEPSLGNLYQTAGVGDVGYIGEGRFHRLFNILLPADDPSHRSFGVLPLEPKVSEHVISGILRPSNFCSAGVTLESNDLGPFATRLPIHANSGVVSLIFS